MGKTIKNLLLQNQESFEAVLVYSSGTEVCSNDDPRTTMNLFMARSNLCFHTILYGENVEESFSQNVLKTNGLNFQCSKT